MTVIVVSSMSVPEGADEVDVPVFLPVSAPAPKMSPNSTAAPRAIQSGRQEWPCLVPWVGCGGGAGCADGGIVDGIVDGAGGVGDGVWVTGSGGVIAPFTGALADAGAAGEPKARGSLELSCIYWLLAGTFCSLLSVASQRGLQKALFHERLSLDR
jgi:hypothetical protein